MRAVQGSRFSVWFYRAMCADLLRERRVAALRRKDSSAELGDALQLGLGDSLGLDVGGGKLKVHVTIRVWPEADTTSTTKRGVLSPEGLGHAACTTTDTH